MAPATQVLPQPAANSLRAAALPNREQRTTLRAAKPPPRNFVIEAITAATVPDYRRLLSLLLPIRYPDKFYHDAIENATPDTIALCALWQDPATSKSTIIAGIQCRRLEIPTEPRHPSPYTPQQTTHLPPEETLYIQTLATLAPYRSLGVATALLEAAINVALNRAENVTSIYAHVWESNTDALEWYQKRGFDVESGVVEGYYRKLKPAGARIVKRRLGVGDHLRAKGETIPEGNVRDLEGERANG